MTLGSYLVAKRDEARLTQKQVARRMSRSQAAVCAWEADTKTPGDGSLRRLCGLIGADMAQAFRLLAEARGWHRVPCQRDEAEDARLAGLAVKEAA